MTWLKYRANRAASVLLQLSQAAPVAAAYPMLYAAHARQYLKGKTGVGDRGLGLGFGIYSPS